MPSKSSIGLLALGAATLFRKKRRKRKPASEAKEDSCCADIKDLVKDAVDAGKAAASGESAAAAEGASAAAAAPSSDAVDTPVAPAEKKATAAAAAGSGDAAGSGASSGDSAAESKGSAAKSAAKSAGVGESKSSSGSLTSEEEKALEEAKTIKEAGNKAYKAGQFEEALELYGKALSVAPERHAFRAVLHSNRAAALQGLKRLADAAEECNAALRENPLHLKALGRRSRVLEAMGNLRESLRDTFAEWMVKERQNPGKTTLAAAAETKMAAIVARLRSEHVYKPRRVMPVTSFVTAYLSGFHEDFLPPVPAGSTIESTTAVINGGGDGIAAAYMTRAQLHMATENYKAAAPDFEAASEDSDFDMRAEALNMWGTFLHLMGDDPASTEALLTSSRLRPGLCNTWIKLAGMEFDLGNEEKTDEYLEKAKEVGGTVGDFFYHYGQIQVARNKLVEALASFTKAAELDSGNALAHSFKSICYFRLGRPDDARASIKDAEDAGPTVALVQHYKAEILCHLEGAAAAEPVYHYAIELDAACANTYVSLANLALQLRGDPEEALTWLNKALEEDPDLVPAYVKRAQVQVTCGRRECLDDIDRAVALSRSPLDLEEALLVREHCIAKMLAYDLLSAPPVRGVAK